MIGRKEAREYSVTPENSPCRTNAGERKPMVLSKLRNLNSNLRAYGSDETPKGRTPLTPWWQRIDMQLMGLRYRCVCLGACVFPNIEETPRQPCSMNPGQTSGWGRVLPFPFSNKRKKLERDPFPSSVPGDLVFLAQWRESDPWAWNPVVSIEFIYVWCVIVYYGFVWGWIRLNTLNPSQPSAYENIGLQSISR